MTSAPKLTPTTTRQVVIAALAGALIGLVALNIFDLLKSFPPVVPWSVPVLLVLLAVAAFGYARTIPKRLEERRLPPREAVRAVVMAKSLIVTGAVLAGGHAVYVGRWIPTVAAPLPAQRVWLGAATIVAAGVCAWAGWVLERACMIDQNGGDEPQTGESAPSPEAV
ncbi:MAG: DUF3180 domain-containing protein [Propionibacteriaceae bacterium]|nr:DUF3180 domain-containing protein [Propionibacteriaceae bacterium]